MPNFGRTGNTLVRASHNSGVSQPELVQAPQEEEDHSFLEEVNGWDAAGMFAGLAGKASGPLQLAADILSANKKLNDALEKALEDNPGIRELLGNTPAEVLVKLQIDQPNIYAKLCEQEEAAPILSIASLTGGGAAGLAAGAVTGSWIITGGASLLGGVLGSSIGGNMLGLGEDNTKAFVRQIVAAAKSADPEAALDALDAKIGAMRGTDGDLIASAEDIDAGDGFDSGLPVTARMQPSRNGRQGSRTGGSPRMVA